MTQSTQRYKRTLKGSIGSGMKSVLGSGRRYYILEHKVSSKYHKAGENQQIIVDQIELGRASTCQVRFDESFGTVSRHHAAIVKDGDNWKLIPLSTTNSTFLNGKRVQKEWYLQNGDEIQLSVNGPKLGFITLAGKKGTVGSLGLTRRLSLFRKQALRPYKYAIACLATFLVMGGATAGFIIHKQQLDIKNLLIRTETQSQLIAQAKDKWAKDSTTMANDIATAKKNKGKTVYVNQGGGGGGYSGSSAGSAGDKTLVADLDNVKPSVYALITTVYFSTPKGTQELSTALGTGFVMSDGRLVTARHCIEPWLFDKDMMVFFAFHNTDPSTYKIYAKILAVNCKNQRMELTDADFHIDRSLDVEIDVPVELDGEKVNLRGVNPFGSEAALGNDWAYTRKVSHKGNIVNGASLSSSLKGGTKAHLLGFPQGIGIADGNKIVEPIYNELTISRNGLNSSRCIMVNQGVDHGNSGGPVFVMNGKNLVVIGIVSRGDGRSSMYNHIIPLCNLK